MKKQRRISSVNSVVFSVSVFPAMAMPPPSIPSISSIPPVPSIPSNKGSLRAEPREAWQSTIYTVSSVRSIWSIWSFWSISSIPSKKSLRAEPREAWQSTIYPAPSYEDPFLILSLPCRERIEVRGTYRQFGLSCLSSLFRLIKGHCEPSLARRGNLRFISSHRGQSSLD